MAFTVERNGVYGDWKAVGRDPDDKKTFRCVCVRCGAKKLRHRKLLKTLPECGCDQPHPDRVVEVEVNKGRQLVTTMSQALGGLRPVLDRPGDDEDEERAISKFEVDVGQISDLLESADSADGVRLFQLASLKMLVDLVPAAEEAYREDPKQSNAYTINALLTQIRELITDLTSEDDRSELVSKIMIEILHPNFLQMGQILIDNMYALRKEIEGDVQPDRSKRVNQAFDQTMRDMAKAFQDLFFKIKTSVAEQVN